MRLTAVGGARVCAWPSEVIPLLLLLLVSATAQVPRLDLAKWNQAYKLTVTNISPQVQSDYYLVRDDCNATGFDSDPAAAPLESCYYKQDENGTYSLWKKKSGDIRVNNNCYCYALNVIRNGFCIPGTGNFTLRDYMNSGRHLTCDLLRQAVMSDGAREVAKEVALTTQPATGHYIGIMVRSKGCNPYHCWQDDFHAVRKDSNQLWSWKEPGGPVSARDLFGNKIQDPETATLPGHYSFCGYFWVNPATMVINTNSAGGYTLAALADFYTRIPGVQATLQPSTPYNHTVDSAFDKWSQKLIDEDLLWESKRGTPEWDAYYDTAAQGSGQAGSSKERGGNMYSVYNLPLDSNNAGSAASSSSSNSSSSSSAPAAPSNLNTSAYRLYNLPITDGSGSGSSTGAASGSSSSSGGTAGSGSTTAAAAGSSQGTAAGSGAVAVAALTPGTTGVSSSSTGKNANSNPIASATAGVASSASSSKSSTTVASSSTKTTAATAGNAAIKAGSTGGSSSSASSNAAALSSGSTVVNRFAAASPPVARPAVTATNPTIVAAAAGSKPKQQGSMTTAAAASSSSRSRKLLGSA